MSKPTKAHNPQEQYKLERKKFEKRMKPKPVLAEQIKRRQEREAMKNGSEKVNFEEML